MDVQAISSPLLKSLDYVIYHQSPDQNGMQKSEWPLLTEALLAGGNIQSLRVQSKQDSVGPYRSRIKMLSGDEPAGPIGLNLTTKTQLPALKHLGLSVEPGWGVSAYPWTKEHCRMLGSTVDLSQVELLDFEGDYPSDFFKTWAGLLPNLRSLKFGVVKPGGATAAARFIESIPDLESLEIIRAQTGIETLWPAIQMHKNSLKKLVFRPTPGDYGGVNYIHYDIFFDVIDQCSVLEWLGWEIPYQKTKVCHEDDLAAYKGHTLSDTDEIMQLDKRYFPLMKKWLKLRRLDLFLHIPAEKTEFSDRLVQDVMGTIPAPGLNSEACRKEAQSMIKSFSRAQGVPMECLTLYLSRTGYQDRCQPYLMEGHIQARQVQLGENESRIDFRGSAAWKGNWTGISYEDERKLSEGW